MVSGSIFVLLEINLGLFRCTLNTYYIKVRWWTLIWGKSKSKDVEVRLGYAREVIKCESVADGRFWNQFLIDGNTIIIGIHSSSADEIKANFEQRFLIINFTTFTWPGQSRTNLPILKEQNFASRKKFKFVLFNHKLRVPYSIHLIINTLNKMEIAS